MISLYRFHKCWISHRSQFRKKINIFLRIFFLISKRKMASIFLHNVRENQIDFHRIDARFNQYRENIEKSSINDAEFLPYFVNNFLELILQICHIYYCSILRYFYSWKVQNFPKNAQISDFILLKNISRYFSNKWWSLKMSKSLMLIIYATVKAAKHSYFCTWWKY